MPQHNIRVLLIDENAERAGDLSRTLAQQGYQIAGTLASRDDLLSRVRELNPDVVIVDIESPDRDTLECLRQVNEDQPRPIVMFVDRTEEFLTQQAIRAGVSAYVVDGLNPSRVKPILDAAIARFREYQALRGELQKTKETLAERKLIERAKGVLMKRRQMDEEAAYALLRRMAMDRNQRLADVARGIIDFSEVL
ncbi:MAG: ANTAR domain-containing protein [Bdellovibrionota bacterium]